MRKFVKETKYMTKRNNKAPFVKVAKPLEPNYVYKTLQDTFKVSPSHLPEVGTEWSVLFRSLRADRRTLRSSSHSC